MFGSRLCKIRWEKHYTAFVNAVEGSEIYNFPIHHIVHFYSRFLRKTRSSRGSPQRSAPEREHARATASPARHAATRQLCPAPAICRFGARARTQPKDPLSKAALSPCPRACRRTVSRVAPRSVGRRRPVVPPSVHRSLGGSRFAYKGAAALASPR
jgi:hypothetical protein